MAFTKETVQYVAHLARIGRFGTPQPDIAVLPFNFERLCIGQPDVAHRFGHK